MLPDFPVNQDLNLARFTNGTLYLKGVLDEARIESGARSSNWIWASYLTVATNSTLSSYAAVSQQSPALNLAFAASELIVCWPAHGVGFRLLTATDLAPPVTWEPVAVAPALTNGEWQIPFVTGQQFQDLDSVRFGFLGTDQHW